MGAKQKESSKGNPAYKRMQNPRKKALRKECWLRGERKKEARRLAQFQREVANNAARDLGLPLPYQRAKMEREARRAERKK